MAIPVRTRDIPAGLVGEIRRTVAGARFDVDHRHAELEFDLVVRGSGSFTLDNENYALKPGTLIWLAITGLLGAGFIGIELHEFAHLIEEGAGPQRSAFLSSFFTLVGTHGLHVTFGIVWLVTLMVQAARYGLIAENRRRLMCLSMFWPYNSTRPLL